MVLQDGAHFIFTWPQWTQASHGHSVVFCRTSSTLTSRMKTYIFRLNMDFCTSRFFVGSNLSTMSTHFVGEMCLTSLCQMQPSSSALHCVVLVLAVRPSRWPCGQGVGYESGRPRFRPQPSHTSYLKINFSHSVTL